ncbi:NADH-quinone oxidoreductase subunit C [Desulfohalovibrio reitneri]|uniref:NADH-quinone oxidoreductase subunit C n=1 Tax=Desulfohalovibrio reitneri TaxID=1307759 RepID=UPI0004A6D79B|nr:NADH-quinone oxidoreductase subunit C [Desulfohalovibrio reitneri]
MKGEIIEVTKDNLVSEALRLKEAGHRMVTMTCLELDEETFELIYHFDKDLEMTHLRLRTPKTEPVPSLTPVLFMAVLVENEAKDHFGVCFEDLPLDFNGALYLEEEVKATPFCRYSVSKQ